MAVSTARLPPAAARGQAVQEPAQHAPDGRGVRDEEVVAGREQVHGGATERPGGRPEAGLVHDPAGGAAQHDRRAADAAEELEERSPAPSPSSESTARSKRNVQSPGARSTTAWCARSATIAGGTPASSGTKRKAASAAARVG